MAREIINIGAAPDDHTGDTARAGGAKINSMTAEIYALALALTGLNLDGPGLAAIVSTDTELQAFQKLQRLVTYLIDNKLLKTGDTMSGTLDMDGNPITNVPNAVNDGDVPNLAQVNAAADGRKPKDAARAGSVTDDVVHFGEQTIDGISLVTGDRFLDKDNADKTQRGVWIVDAADWTRSADCDTGLKIQGAEVQVTLGLVNAGTLWYQYAFGVTIDVTDLYWQQQSAGVPDATSSTKGKAYLINALGGGETNGAATVYAVEQALAGLSVILSDILAEDNSAGNQNIKDLTDPVDDQDADTKAARNVAIAAEASARSAADAALQTAIDALNAIVGSAAPDGDSFVDTVTELLAVFSTYPEGTDLFTLLSGKVSITDIENTLTYTLAGKVLDARQGKVLNDLITALTATVALKAVDSAVVHNTGNETVAGIKTFSSSIIVPDLSVGENSGKGVNAKFVQDTLNNLGGDEVELALTKSSFNYTQR